MRRRGSEKPDGDGANKDESEAGDEVTDLRGKGHFGLPKRSLPKHETGARQGVTVGVSRPRKEVQDNSRLRYSSHIVACVHGLIIGGKPPELGQLW